MRPISPIPTRLEASILKILWKTSAPMTVSDVAKVLRPSRHYNTVLTLLRIMERKGYATRKGLHQTGTRGDFWRASISQAKAQQLAIADLEKTFGIRVARRAA